MAIADFPVGTSAWWNARYQAGDTPWDTGIVPPEVVALVGCGALPRGWALDLGCGSGVTSRYLAQHGFAVIGIDLALSALVRGRRSAAAADLAAHFCLGDVADLGFLRVRAVLAIDIGCFHALPPERRPGYVASLADHLVPGAFYLLYAFESSPAGPMAWPGVAPHELACFAPALVLRWTQHGLDRDRPAAWYLWQRV
ncbi:MAG: class I SAM-dependent methyltransferase [Anaerolineae bacterium]|nr:class I SAM-dependent methyltransferase [Anaerolineae bacterium]